MASTFTLTGDLATLGLTTFATNKVRAHIRSNLGKGDALIDSTAGLVMLGDEKVDVASDGTFTVDLIDTDATDLNVEAGTLRYELVVDYVAGGSLSRVGYSSGWFELTASADISALDLDLPSVTPAWRTAFTAEMEALLAETEAARDGAVAIAGPVDATVEALVNNTGGVGPLTSAALTATYATRTAGGKGLARVVNRSDYATLAAAITAAGSYGTVHYDEGSSWNEPPTTISIPVTIEGRGVRIYKNANGALFTITAADVRIGRGLWLIGNAPTYTGPGIVVTGSGTTSRTGIECKVSNCEEWAIDFGIGAGQVARIESPELGTYVRSAADAAMTSASAVLTSATAAFTARDIGKYALVEGALRTDQPTWHLLSKIVSVDSATQVTLADVAGATTSGADLQYGHPAIRFGAEYAAGVNGDRTIVNPYAGGWLLADIGGAQNLNIIGGNFRNVVYSDAQSAKVSITGARIATSGSPVAIRGVSHVFTANTCAGDIVATTDAAQANIAGNVASGSVLDYGADTIVDGSVNAHPPHTMDPRALLNTGTLNANQTIYLRAKGRGYVSKIGVHVSASSGNICVAVYGNNGSPGTGARPAVRKATSGSVVCPAIGYAEVALTSPIYMEEGDWLALSADNATAAFYRGGAGGFTSSLANGTSHFQSVFPCPSPAAASATGAVYSFVMTGVV